MPASKIKRPRIRAGQKLHEKIWKRHHDDDEMEGGCTLLDSNAGSSINDNVEAVCKGVRSGEEESDHATGDIAVAVPTPLPPSSTSTCSCDSVSTATSTSRHAAIHSANIEGQNETTLGYISPTIISNPPSPLILHPQAAPSSSAMIPVPSAPTLSSVSASAPLTQSQMEMEMKSAQGICPSINSQSQTSTLPAPHLTPQQALHRQLHLQAQASTLAPTLAPSQAQAQAQAQAQRHTRSDHTVVEQLSQKAIQDFIQKLCDSADGVMMERNALPTAGLAGNNVDHMMDVKAWREWQKLEGKL
jgi:hypothetical protein